MRSTKAIRIAKISYIILSSLFIVLGVGLIALRDLSVWLMGSAAGVMLFAFGIVMLIGDFCKDLYGLAFQFDLSLGLMLAVLGVIILRNPDQAMSFLCLMLGIATMADGLFKLQSALDARRFGLKSWLLLLTLAVSASAVVEREFQQLVGFLHGLARLDLDGAEIGLAERVKVDLFGKIRLDLQGGKQALELLLMKLL